MKIGNIVYSIIVIFIVFMVLFFFIDEDKQVEKTSSYEQSEKIVSAFEYFNSDNISSGYFYNNNNSNIVAIEISFLGGSSLDTINQEGISELLVESMLLGAGGYSIFDFQRLLDDSSISLNGRVDRDKITITLTTLKRYLPQALNILDMIINKPNLGTKEIAMAKSRILTSYSLSQNSPSFLLIEAMNRELFPNNKYYRSSYDSISKINKITVLNLKEFKKKVITKSNTYVAVSGNIGDFPVDERLNNIFKNIARGEVNFHLPKIEPKIENKEVEVYQEQATQSTIYIIFKIPAKGSRNYIFAKVFNSYLGGITDSVLFNKLRNEEGLVYGINSQVVENTMSSYGVIVLATSLDKADKAISKVKEVLRDIKSSYNFDDIKATRDWLLNNDLRNFSTNNDIANFINYKQINNETFIDYLQSKVDLQALTKYNFDNALKEIDFDNLLILKIKAKK